MKIFIFAAVLAICAPQVLHGIPVENSSTTTENNEGTTVTTTTGGDGQQLNFEDFKDLKNVESGTTTHYYSSRNAESSGSQMTDGSSGSQMTDGSSGSQMTDGSSGGGANATGGKSRTTKTFTRTSTSNTGDSTLPNGGKTTVYSGDFDFDKYGGGATVTGGKITTTETSTSNTGESTLSAGGKTTTSIDDLDFDKYASEALANGGKTTRTTKTFTRTSTSNTGDSTLPTGGKTTVYSGDFDFDKYGGGATVTGGKITTTETSTSNTGESTLSTGGKTTTSIDDLDFDKYASEALANGGKTTRTTKTFTRTSTSNTGDSTLPTGGKTTVNSDKYASGATVTGGKITTTETRTSNTGDSTLSTGGKTTTSIDDLDFDKYASEALANGGKTTRTTKTFTRTSTSNTGDSTLPTGGKTTVYSGDFDFDKYGGGATVTGGKITTTETSTSNTGDSTTETKSTVEKNTINIDDDSLEGIDLEKYNFDVYNYETQTDIIQQKMNQECQRRIEERDQDNDILTNQLKRANTDISELSSENSYYASELGKCRDDNDAMSKSYKLLSVDVKVWMKKYKMAEEDVTRLTSLTVSQNAENSSWKTKVDSIHLQYISEVEINNQNIEIIKERTKTIENLQQINNDNAILLTNCGAESVEWKKKYEVEVEKSHSLSMKQVEFENTITDLETKIEKLTNELLICQTKDQDNGRKIDELKDNVKVLEKQNSNITDQLNDYIISFNTLNITYNEDEIQDAIVQKLLDQANSKIDSCNGRNEKWEVDYNFERDLRNGLEKKTAELQGVYQESCRKYDTQIKEMTSSYEAKLAKCQLDVDIERTNIFDLNVNITNLRNELTTIRNEWTISLQSASNWELKSNNCDAHSLTLNENVKTLQTTVFDSNKQLDSCIERNKKFNEDLSTCNVNKASLDDKAEEAAKDIKSRDTTIYELKSEIQDITDDKDICIKERDESRCAINKLLFVIDEALNNAKQLTTGLSNKLNDSQSTITAFGSGNNIECKTCAADGPCFSGGGGSDGKIN